jgi:hypothetical protein
MTMSRLNVLVVGVPLLTLVYMVGIDLLAAALIGIRHLLGW